MESVVRRQTKEKVGVEGGELGGLIFLEGFSGSRRGSVAEGFVVEDVLGKFFLGLLEVGFCSAVQGVYLGKEVGVREVYFVGLLGIELFMLYF